MSEYQYRKVLYKDYFNSQSGRTFQLDIQKKLRDEGRQLAAEILPLLPTNKSISILDIGCGYGSLIYLLKAKGYTNLKGIDLSEGQVKVAHEIGLQSEVEKRDIKEFLSDKANHFDVISGLDIIEHFSKDELVELLQIVLNSLKTGGIAIFRTPNMDAPFSTLFANGDFTHENYLNYSSANQVMMNIGFSKTQVSASHLETAGFLKELIRKITWAVVSVGIKLIVFASARSPKAMVMTPNLIIKAEK